MVTTTTIRPSTRNFLELRVGSTHTIEVLLHVQHKDREWFSQDSVKDQLLHLMTTRIEPREYQAEIERYHERVHGTMTGAGTKTGEKNEKLSLNSKATTTGKAARKRKRNPKAAPVLQAIPLEKPRRDIRHVFDDNLHLTYRLQDLNSSAGATLSVASSPDNLRGNMTFRQYPKLSKRLVVWCFPRQDQHDATDLPVDTPDGGFPRPELIPIAGLFR